MKKDFFKRIFVSLAMVTLFISGLATNVSAQPLSKLPSNNKEQSTKDEIIGMTEYINENTINVSDKEKEQLLNKTKSLIESGTVEHHSNNEKIFNNADVRGIEYEDGTIQYNVSFTYADEKDMSRVSMLNIIFNEDQKTVFKTYEVDMYKDQNEKNGIVKSWVDGKLDKNETFDISNLPGGKTETIQKDDMVSTQGWTGCMSNCLGNKNISLWAITGLGILCGAACTAGVPATAGTACYACVNSAGIIGVNAVFDCLDKC